MKESSGYRQTVPLSAACVLAFLIPFPFPFGAGGVIALSFFSVVFRGQHILRNYSRRRLLWVWTALYLWHACSWFWSADKVQANADLTTKLSLLILPVIVGSAGIYRRENLQKVLLSFVLGMVVIAIYCLVQAPERYRTEGPEAVFYHALVQDLDANAVYMSWYVLTALLVLLFEPLRLRFWGRVPVRLLLMLPLLVFFGMLIGRTMLFLLLFGALPIALIQSFRTSTARPEKILTRTAVIMALLAGVLAFQQPEIRSRFQEFGKSDPGLSFLSHYQGEEDQFSNLNVRLFLWRVGLENLQSAPVLLAGTGIGDAHTAINARIQQLGIRNMEPPAVPRSPFYDINLHNTYLHITLMTGLVGLLLLLAAVFSPLGAVWRRFRHSPFDVLFLLASALFMMQEAIFQTQAGVICYLFFSSLLLACHYDERDRQQSPVGQ